MSITNAEKFKTALERTNQFNKACKGECTDCKIFEAKKYQHTMNCPFVWLEMEAVEAEPLPCPFCGSEIEVIVNEDLYKIECNNSECICSSSTRYFSNKDDAIEAWNKRG